MLNLLERVLNFQLTVVELACGALLLGAPYLAVGIVWASTHTAYLEQLQGLRLMVSLFGSIALWPALAFGGVCLT
ncbi:hypothetical protein [Mycobacterium noviomagense]|uniref:Uncharacterized protein n=1 Tax=Mycobacterium noviomagense TaxID=459858 RepID=A0A7I7PHA7_9MYCO|nr:hypothetical protein [Mycobacterium noviomagense]ORB14617.1 hypothetical protein BST37_10735 [Mycobacterium noviomagense]BBY08017.1 hypothetical protein MNVI_33350 [Mycobacterium noviomagense]